MIKLCSYLELSLYEKLEITRRVLREYTKGKNNIVISFSGGLDSTVLLHLVRSLVGNIPAMFLNSGNEYPEIRKFALGVDNVQMVKPKVSFLQVISEYGYPVISKEVSQRLFEFRTSRSQYMKDRLLAVEGYDFKYRNSIPKKYRHLLYSHLKISHKCCTFIKKRPMNLAMKGVDCNIQGCTALESMLRQQRFSKYGFEKNKREMSVLWPIAHWTKEDCFQYLREREIPYCELYDLGYQRTGCMFCLYGVHREEYPNKIQLMSATHPQFHRYMIRKLNLLEWSELLGFDCFIECSRDQKTECLRELFEENDR
jgi:3'-phosphoadenosine 5'-phosphosulfate sulfotransferase (PAPS reductase)/FAD synthetase